MSYTGGKAIRAVQVVRKRNWWVRILGPILAREVWLTMHHKAKPPTWVRVPINRMVAVTKADGATFLHATDRLFCRIYCMRGDAIDLGRLVKAKEGNQK